MKEKNGMKKTIENAIWTIAKAGAIGIITLLLTNIVYAAIPVSDGFDYPVGWSDHAGYQISGWNFLENETSSTGNITHPGEDWNGDGGGDTDLGDPVNATANGHVVASSDFGCGWGNITLIEHKLQNGTIVWSNYAHLETMLVANGDYVSRGQQIGTIGKGITSDLPCNKIYPAHLHFEMRRNYLSPSNWLPMVKNYSQVVANYYNPSDFIDSHRPQTSPLIGDWNNDNIDETGTFNPRTSIFSLKDENNLEIVSQQFGEPGDLPIVGDWDKDGTDTIGVYRPKEAKFFLDNNNDGIIDPVNDQELLFGDIGDYSIVGDWNGDGKDEIGVFRSIDTGTLKTTFFLRNPDGTVNSVEFGAQTDMPIIGDWNNDGKDDVGVFRRNDPDYGENAVFYLKYGDTIIDPIAFGNNDDIPTAGKPQIDKLTRVGIYRPSTGEFIFKPEPIIITPGPAHFKLDLVFLIDTTGSMGDDIANVKLSAKTIVEVLNLTGLDYRVAIADYKDYPCCGYGGSEDYVYKLDLPFTTNDNKQNIINAINGLYASGGADWRESVYSAYYLAMTDANKDNSNTDNYGWRKGVAKAIIIMGDAPPHIPEPCPGGHTLEEIISKSKEIDPVIAYSIVVGSDQTTYDTFAEISNGTGGKVYSSPTADDVVNAIIEAIGDIEEPVASYGVSINIAPTSAETTVGNSASYEANITNVGNTADTYNISLELKNFGFQRGYPVAIQSSWTTFNSSQMTLNGSTSEIRSLTINIPKNWAGMEDATYAFSVTATSTTDASIGNISSAELKVKAGKRSMAEYSKLEIQWLAEMVENSGVDSGIKNALLAKLANAESKVDQAIVNVNNNKQFGNSLNTAQNLMNAFINQVNAQYDKKIMQPDAEALKEKANQIWQNLETAKNS